MNDITWSDLLGLMSENENTELMFDILNDNVKLDDQINVKFSYKRKFNEMENCRNASDRFSINEGEYISKQVKYS